VSSGLRILKTSTALAESGVLDIMYGMEGLQTDEQTPIQKNLSKSATDRSRFYLAAADTH